MFAFAFEARLFKFTYREPHFPALFQLPPTSATRSETPTDRRSYTL